MRIHSPLVAAAALVCFLGALVRAECPNGCSGNGDCMAKDMCECYHNFQGNDCADRTCLFGRAHVDTPKGDIDMDQDRKSPDWILENSQQHPAGTYEYFYPDAKTNEAHFYMECSNKGICDRSTGLCQCFDGYEGNGCQRTTCPNSCSGHGTCESIRELGAKAGGTLFGTEGAAGALIYDLWDSNSTYGCRCDPWFFGPDCSKRTCKVGVDPLFLSTGTANYETFVIHAYMTGTYPTDPSWIRLRLFDFYGESFITAPIKILDAVTTAANKPINAKAVADAIKAVPNLTFRDVTCEEVGREDTKLEWYLSVAPVASTKGMSVICQFSDNPGKMRIPEVASFDFPGIADADKDAIVVTTSQQGMNDEWFPRQSKIFAASVDNVYGTGTGLLVTVAANPDPDPSDVSVFPANRLIKIGSHVVLAVSATASVITLKYPLWHSLGDSPPIFLNDALSAITVTVLTAFNEDVLVGEDVWKFTAAQSVVPGDTLFFHNAFYTVQQKWVASSKYHIKVDKPFGGSAVNGGKADKTTDVAYKVNFPADKSKFYNYVSECSGRGLCGYDSGICTCFKGYTNDNCNRQNILAL